jgi:hypothetical protein
MEYIIYSLRKKQWFKENRCGYTDNKGEAGRYSGEETLEALWKSQAGLSKLPELAVMQAPKRE